ncbi:MAG TPA: nuclease domain-containing protein [Prosthecobacter sp.]|nr:nuclease domain-containing protein [Prosthecobacter sp.]
MTPNPNRLQSKGFGKPPARIKLRDIEREPQISTRRGVISRCEVAAPVPKTEPKRNRALLEMARGRRCLLAIPLLCKDERETVVAAHSNKAEHGKSTARKADDQYSVWACFRCHHFIDQGPAPGRMKDGFWQLAHLDQVLEWRRIVGDMSEPKRFRDAAQWALDQLNATTVGS